MKFIEMESGICFGIMRIIATLDPDEVQKLAQVRKGRKASLQDIVNEALRHGLRNLPSETARRKRFRVEPFPNMRLLIDISCISKVLDEMDTEEFLAKNPDFRKKA